ncbi:SET domain-containing protein [Schizopora paradoxa]|uniref:SET domain-containing protein n=1 Tax=Schizopora paradoxa TaxID=27342 RepID=A0A0H2RFM9_9AGAM|nr:SET domain-containing protein [Schizopora paradoxa]
MDIDDESTLRDESLTADESPEYEVPTVTRKIVISKFREVWNDFYDWEEVECAYLLKDIISVDDTDYGDHEDDEYPRQADIRDYRFVVSSEVTGLTSEFDAMRTSFHASGNGRKRRMDSVNIFAASQLEPLSSYESSTPSTMSIGPRWNGLREEETLSFVPFSDDPTFDFEEFSMSFGWFEWLSHEMKVCRDPDLEQIEIETFTRLFNLFEEKGPLAFREIDMAGADIIDVSRDGDKQSGILPIRYTRDPVSWMFQNELGRDEPEENLDGAHPTHRTEGVKIEHIYPSCVLPASSAVIERVQQHRSLLCTNMFCLLPGCRTHGKGERIGRVMPVAHPQMTNERLLERDVYPCGDECFLHRSTEAYAPWDDDSLGVLQEILSVIPDELPCRLARTVRKPCQEVFSKRKEFIPDDSVYIENDSDDDDAPVVTIKPRIDQAFAGAPSEPCFHNGPCSKENKCPCWEKKMYCQRLCNCASNWSSDGKVVDANVKETDPLATAKDALASRNCQIQRGQRKRVLVKESDFGMGLFCGEKATAGDLLGEYVGDMVPHNAAFTREYVSSLVLCTSPSNHRSVFLKFRIVAKHKGRNYAFTLSPFQEGDNTREKRKLVEEAGVLDAIGIANETRFPNHSDGKGKNSYAKASLVDNQVRIGLYASRAIKVGEQILFYYSAEFFR